MFPVQPGLFLTQILTSQLVLDTPQLPTCQSIQSIPQLAQVTTQVSQVVQVVSQIQTSQMVPKISQILCTHPIQAVLQTPYHPLN